MAAMISFTCPECKTQLKGPADMQGKKARCKRCSHIFVLQANASAATAPTVPATRGKTARPASPAAKTSPTKPVANKPAAAKPAATAPEEMTYSFQEDTEVLPEGAGGAKSTTPHGSQNPYGITELDLAPRCPFCAQEMESEEAVICLHCGYNKQTRSLPAVTRTYANTPGEIFMWLLPGILCVVGILALIGLICYLWLSLDPAKSKTAWYGELGAVQALQVWGTIFSGFAIFILGMFAIRRLILHPTPPEMEKK